MTWGLPVGLMMRTIDGILRTLNKMRKLQVPQVLVRPLILLDLLREYSCFLVFSDDRIRDEMWTDDDLILGLMLEMLLQISILDSWMSFLHPLESRSLGKYWCNNVIKVMIVYDRERNVLCCMKSASYNRSEVAHILELGFTTRIDPLDLIWKHHSIRVIYAWNSKNKTQQISTSITLQNYPVGKYPFHTSH